MKFSIFAILFTTMIAFSCWSEDSSSVSEPKLTWLDSMKIADARVEFIVDSLMLERGVRKTSDSLISLLPPEVSVSTIFRESDENSARARENLDGFIGMICGTIRDVGPCENKKCKVNLRPEEAGLFKNIDVRGVAKEIAFTFNKGEGVCLYGKLNWIPFIGIWEVKKMDLNKIYSNRNYNKWLDSVVNPIYQEAELLQQSE